MTLTDLTTQFDIDASASRVWSVLCDLEHYGEWNPWVRNARGQLDVGTVLELQVSPPDTDPETVNAIVERVSPISTIILRYDWGEVCGRQTLHQFRLEPIRTGTRLHQLHQVIEAGSRADNAPFQDRTVLALEMMNVALKARAER